MHFTKKVLATHSGKKALYSILVAKLKCLISCPTLKVHNDVMEKKLSTKYLGNISSTNGGQDENIEDRRCKGWGKIATIMGILSEVDMGVHKLEGGIML